MNGRTRQEDDLLKTVGDGGNYLLNIGPRPDGTFEPEAISCMQQVGQWLARHGNTVYGTTGGPFVVDGQYTSTRKGKQINLFLFDKKRQKSDAERAGQ
ncbi:alpha-L-fucosidase [Spirosoma luteum]|uniref:alpha-L-fucosidase n=1 Tax=Spirosoma luteum TaxID=431553 RepID=UPI000A06F5C1